MKSTAKSLFHPKRKGRLSKQTLNDADSSSSFPGTSSDIQRNKVVFPRVTMTEPKVPGQVYEIGFAAVGLANMTLEVVRIRSHDLRTNIRQARTLHRGWLYRMLRFGAWPWLGTRKVDLVGYELLSRQRGSGCLLLCATSTSQYNNDRVKFIQLQQTVVWTRLCLVPSSSPGSCFGQWRLGRLGCL
jgi:hypothetical protein